jgi:hypothetical protein
MSMLIGPTRHGPSIDAAAWRALAEDCALSWTAVFDVVVSTVAAVEQATPLVLASAREDGAPAAFTEGLEKRIVKRTQRCLHQMGARHR